MSALEPEQLAQRVATVHQRIADAGGDPDRIRLLAVTKGFGPEAVRAALAVGLVDLGENYAQELVAKAAAIEGDDRGGGPGPRWHAIGRLQRNKVRLLAPLVSCWQSVDREALGREVARRAPGASVLVQVNVSDEAAKGGCRPGETGDLVARLGDLGLVVDGLMTVGRTGPAAGARAGFARLRGLADDLGLVERSMGMTADLEAAVAEGSTQIRVGRALFGERPRQKMAGPGTALG